MSLSLGEVVDLSRRDANVTTKNGLTTDYADVGDIPVTVLT